MSLGFEDFEIVVERGRETAANRVWIWHVRHRDNGAVHRSGRSWGSRAVACGDAIQAVFQLLTASRPASGETLPDRRTLAADG